jgi:hypothetical protein
MEWASSSANLSSNGCNFAYIYYLLFVFYYHIFKFYDNWGRSCGYGPSLAAVDLNI